MDGVRAMSEGISPGFSLPVLVQVRDLLSGTQKVSDPGRRMEGLGKDKGRPKDRARAPTVAVTGSGGGRRRSASVAASGGGAIAVYSSASVELNRNVTQQSSNLSSPSAGAFWTHLWSVRNKDKARRSQEPEDNLDKQKQRREPSLAPAVELLE
ncbi:uncharacterized protein BKA55DRAFT_533976 [Fusarium redolens]|uniref:Uncharacterized protein n=1 Tax=Fusarium redolens TaxID=48865 RepID=A0A9P9R6L1_FUSRE|nr:uncharacterized protein BKA55DRAFT_533976 [Fusarium redolens]KAH7267190.1 hypothetical protein BKA55DRAFT_533976 [Fusarium redolens]